MGIIKSVFSIVVFGFKVFLMVLFMFKYVNFWCWFLMFLIFILLLKDCFISFLVLLLSFIFKNKIMLGFVLFYLVLKV